MRIAIIGAGIAGLALAAALRRRGLDSRVYEQAVELAEVGAGVQLAPNAVRLLQRLGLRDHLRATGVPVGAIERTRWDDGRLLARTKLGDECVRRFGAAYLAVHRADLHRGLLDQVPRDSLLLGKTCTAVREDDGGAEIRFADGSSANADVVVGADGIRSVLRGTFADDEPVFAGQLIYRGLIAAERLPAWAREPLVRMWMGPGKHCVSYPVSAGRLVSFAATVPAPDGPPESWSAEGRAADLLSEYRGWDEALVELLAAVDRPGVWALHDRAPIRRWCTAHTVLAGDAAHPMLPFSAQGANQAIEDAVALAACLAGADPDDRPSALRRYECLRVERTRRIQEGSRANGMLFHQGDGQDQRRRDRAAPNLMSLDSRAWIYGHDAELAATNEEGERECASPR